MGNSRRPRRPKQLLKEYLRCAQCGPDPAAHKASSEKGLLVLHTGQKHGGQQLLPESVGPLRRFDRAACVVCATTRSQRCNRCRLCQSNAPLREFRLGDTFQDRRQPGHQSAAPGGAPADQQPPQSSQPVDPGDPLDDSPLNCPIRDNTLTERDKQLLPELRQASAMALPRSVVSRHATAWAESLKGAMSGHQSWALLCRHRCRLLLAEIPKGVDRNSELKLRLHQWETG